MASITITHKVPTERKENQWQLLFQKCLKTRNLFILLFTLWSAIGYADSGFCGAEGNENNVTWTFDSQTGTLTISGTGAMRDYNYPWRTHLSEIINLTISQGVTNIGRDAFNNYVNLTSVSLASSVTSIGQEAFRGCSSLSAITIPESVTNVGGLAFYGCTSLTSVVWNAKSCDIDDYYHRSIFDNQVTSFIFGEKVKSIPMYICYGMDKLTSITIPESVTNIGDHAFVRCTSLTSVTIPASVESIGVSAFYDCTSLTSITILEGVASIGASAFSGCTSLTSITIPASVESIGASAFSGCTSLTSITIPASVESIGASAFSGCTSLTSITIPASVASIGAFAFAGCTSLTSITIPASVESIGASAFYNCTSLTSVVWNAKSCDIDDFYHSSIFDNQVTSFIFGENVESIPNYLCYGMDKLTSITIPESVTSIGTSAFCGCTSLTSITIPESVTGVGQKAFSGCTSLTSVVWNAQYCYGDYDWSTTIFGSQVRTFIFGENVENIPMYLCYEMNKLTSITIPESVTNIGECAFYYCTSLTSITILGSVTNVGLQAFYGCTSLTSFTAPAICFDVPEKHLTSSTKSLQNVVVNGGELTENGLLFINRSYKTLKTLDVSATSNTEFADEAFKGLYNLDSLSLPTTLQRIGYMMVAGCKNLKSIAIPASVEEIDQSAFEDCRSIQSITFGDATPSAANSPKRIAQVTNSQLRRIGNWAFYNAHELQNLDIPEGVEEIGDGAFYGCTYMEELNLPASVSTIGDNTFALCSKLKKVIVNSTIPPTIQSKTFYDVSRQIPVYVPEEVIADYKSDPYWGKMNIIGISQETTALESVTNVQSLSGTIKSLNSDGQILITTPNGHTYNLLGAEVK